MSNNKEPGWYYADGDPEGSVRFWDGSQWQGGPQFPGVATNQLNDSDKGPEGYKIASPWSRLGAVLLDGLILGLPGSILLILLIANVELSTVEDFQNLIESPRWLVFEVVFAAVSGFYAFYFLKKSGATPGKKVLKIKVVQANGEDLASDDAFRRASFDVGVSFASIIPFLFFVTIGIGIANIFLIFRDDRRQIVHDKFAKTIVVDA